MLQTVLLVVLILALFGALPVYSYNGQWGYFPSGLLGTVLLICLVVFLMRGRVL
jgi:uncharacterized protein DUF3309